MEGQFTTHMRLIKFLVKKVLKQTPYRLERRRDQRVLPDPNLDSIQLVLAYYLASKALPTFIHVGACDGTTGDASYRFISSGRFRALLVEPIADSFRKLGETYKGVPNVTTIQAAIGTVNGHIELFKVKDDATSIDHIWSRQLASFDKGHLLRHGVEASDIEIVSVKSLTLASLIAQNDLNHIDILQIDTEGFDADIVDMALDLPTPPPVIYFENIHLENRKTSAVFEKLKTRGYVWVHDHWNTLAINTRVMEQWNRPPLQTRTC